MLKRALLVFLGFLALWQCIVIVFSLPPYLLPSPATVAASIWRYKLLLFFQGVPTLYEIVLGLFVGVFAGGVTALCLAYFNRAQKWILPVLISSQSIPTFAIAPLLVTWLGFGLSSKIAVTVIMLFFPITSSFYDGLRQTDPAWLDLAKTMGATPFQILLKIRLPAALPALGSGLRVGATIAPIGAIVGEWVGASKGLGFLILGANARVQIDLMFAALTVIVAMALVLYSCVDRLVKSVVFWVAL